MSEREPRTDCRACAYCGIEPDDMNFHCAHPATGSIFGRYIDKMRAVGAACGPDATLFVQPSHRNSDGSLKSAAPSNVGREAPEAHADNPQGGASP